MKQGIGRLIRSEKDRGKVVVLDSRYPMFCRQIMTERNRGPIANDDRLQVWPTKSVDGKSQNNSTGRSMEVKHLLASEVILPFIAEACELGP